MALYRFRLSLRSSFAPLLKRFGRGSSEVELNIIELIYLELIYWGSHIILIPWSSNMYSAPRRITVVDTKKPFASSKTYLQHIISDTWNNL